MVTVRVDDRYRIVLPREARANIQPGDVLIFEERREDGADVLRFAKVPDPLATKLDALADEAIREQTRGFAIDLAKVIRKAGLDPSALPDRLTPEEEERLIAALGAPGSHA